MYNVSSKYLELVQETSRSWDLYMDVQLRNGTQFRLTKHDVDLGSFRLKEGATCSDTVQIGSTYADSVEFRIINEDNKFTEYDFYRAKFWPYVGLDLSGESDFEYVPLGEFNILENVKKFSTIAVVGFNNMCQLNQVFDTSQIVFPTDASTLLAALEQQCAVRVSEAALLEVRSVSQAVNSFLTEEYTCRDVLVGICLLLLKNARFNRAGELEFFWYAECNRNTSPSTRVGNSSYSDSVVNVTGVYLEDMFGSTYTAGTSNYAVELPFSPVIQGSEMSQMVLNRALDKLALFNYRPATITWIGDPALQAGDMLAHTSTAVGDCVVPIMRLVYAFAGTETLESVGTDAASNEQPTASDRKAKQAFTKSEKDRVELSTAIKQTTDSISLEVSAGSVGNRAEIKLSVAGKEYRGYIDLTGLVTFTDLGTSGQTVISGSNITTGIIKSADGSNFYLDLVKGILKGNFAELAISGQTVSDIAQATVDAQTQEDIFNKLTKNGLLQGLYMQDDDLYINADYLVTGILRSKNGDTFYLDLDKGVLKGKFQELSISGKTVDTIAQEKANTAESNAKSYANTAASNAVSAQTQTDIFKKLTNNGALPGLFMRDGQMYINADYLATGILKSKDGTVAINLNDGVVKFFNEVITNGLKVRSTSTGNVNLFEVKASTSGAGTPLCDMYLNTAEGNQIFGVQETVINGVHKGASLGLYDPVSGYRVSLTVNDFASAINFITSSGSGKAVLYMEGDGTVHLQADYINGKKVSWKSNGDGTFTLIGQ